VTDTSSSFEKIARAYDLLVNEQARWNREKPFHQHWLTQAQNNTNNNPPKVLDLGTGTGFHARHYAQSFKTKLVVGLDPSPSMLASAKSKPGGNLITWINAPAEKIPKNLSPFDLILLLGNTLSLIPDTTLIWKSATQISQPGTLFIIQMLNYNQLRKTTTSPIITQKSNDTISITKTLTIHPNPIKNNHAATLDLLIKTNTGDPLAHDHHLLHEHPENSWLPDARNAGWSLQHQQNSFKINDNPVTPGADRVYILMRK